MMADDLYDYVIVGAGSAGCVLADLLSEDGRARVLVLEAGGSDLYPWVQLPIGYGKAFFDAFVNWKYETEPVPALGGKRDYWPRGKVMGGSSAINAMVWARGHRSDFDDWAETAPGWSWDDVLPHFKTIEAYSAGGDEHRGGEGKQAVANIDGAVHPLAKVFLQAADQAGYGVNRDYNGARLDGACLYQINVQDGRRASASRSFLRPALRRRNLVIHLWSNASTILFEGKRASGVRYKQYGRVREARARRAVILAAGAIGSPQLLQCSGVGPPELLRRLGIEVVAPAPAVGRHLQDHVGLNLLYRSRVPTLNQALRPLSGRIKVALEYLLFRTGPLSLSLNHAGGFVRSDPAMTRPDLQLYCQPMSYSKAPIGKRPLLRPDPFPGFNLGFNQTRPLSRGHLEIKSSDAAETPSIHPNYYAHEDDMRAQIAGARIIREIAAAPAMKAVIEEELQPGPETVSDDALERYVRAVSGTVYHPSCTCRMGTDPLASAVSPRLAVHGVEGLKVVDASVFPNVTSANTNAPTMMLAHRAARMIMQDCE